MTPKLSPLVVPVFIPQGGCPHPCVFCNQAVITGVSSLPEPVQVRESILSFLEKCRSSPRPLEIAFYGGNFLGLAPDRINAFLAEAAKVIALQGHGTIRFSTRPDTIDSHRLGLLASYPVGAIELGAQSMDETVLRKSGRGHGAGETRAAALAVKEAGYRLGLQIMTGLPGDDEVRSMETARRIADISPDFVRIYPTLVVAGSPLAALYQSEAYIPWPLFRAVILVKEMLLLFQSRGISVIRMGLQASEDLEGDAVLAGPYHPAFGHLVWSEVAFDAAVMAIEARVQELGPLSEVLLRAHPRWESRFRGMKNENIERLKARYGLETVRIHQDPSVPEGAVIVGDRS